MNLTHSNKINASSRTTLQLLVYTSEYIQTDESVNNVLKDISKKSKVNNANREITGLLFFHNNRFLQIIEGPKNYIQELLEVLEKDPRHTNIQILIDDPIEIRGFESWNMDTFNLEAHDLDPHQLEEICSAYKENLKLQSNYLVSFLKSILEKATI